jgi:hypothetical protein
MNLQQRSYPLLPIPVILPFLADGILALGGTQSEGIFRIPGDNESVSELKSRMDRGHYQLVSSFQILLNNVNDSPGSMTLMSPFHYSSSGCGNLNHL